MNLLLVPLVFLIVLVAELPDKSMFASLVLGTRFHPRLVLFGVAAAFAVHVVIAVLAGGLLALLPQLFVQALVALLFLAGGVYLWFSKEGAAEQLADAEADTADSRVASSAFAAFATSFAVVFVGEWGDITQILTVNLAAKYHEPIVVGIGALLGLWTAALLAVTLGRTLLRFLSVQLLHRIGAVLLLALAAVTATQLAS